MERLQTIWEANLKPHWAFFFLLPALLGLGTLALFVDGRTNPEARAFRTVCSDLAAEVADGSASRFDYMATRCPARWLTDAEAR